MNTRVQNQIRMVGACLSVAQSTDYKSVWTGQEPAGFATGISQLVTDYGAVTAKAARARAASGGAADAKAVAETALIDATFILARALTVHFEATGDLDRRGRVRVTRSQLRNSRAGELLNWANAVRSVAAGAVNEPGADALGITEERLGLLTEAIASYSQLIDLPRGQMVNRNTLIKAVADETAALVHKTRLLDALILQFGGTVAGREFIEAWQRARAIVDIGNGHGTADENGNDAGNTGGSSTGSTADGTRNGTKSTSIPPCNHAENGSGNEAAAPAVTR